VLGSGVVPAELLLVGDQLAGCQEGRQRIDLLRCGRDRDHGVLRVVERPGLTGCQVLRGAHRRGGQRVLDGQRPGTAMCRTGGVALPHRVHLAEDSLDLVPTIVVLGDDLLHGCGALRQPFGALRVGEVLVDLLSRQEHGQPPDLIVWITMDATCFARSQDRSFNRPDSEALNARVSVIPTVI
jgi:hypothetical protein